MKIGIDARFLNESGVGRYLRNLILNLKIIDKKNEYFIYLLKKDYEKFEETRNFRKIFADFNWYGFAEQFKFPNLLKKNNLDLVHFPHFNIPIFYRGQFVVTIHDLIHQHHAMRRATFLNPFSFKIKQIGYKRVFKTAVNKSLKILVPSKSVKELLIREWNIKENKIVITPEAVDEQLLSISEKALKPSINGEYLFYVGNAHPHKNVEGLIKAFLKLKKKYSNLKLVLSGYDHYFWERVKKENKYQDIIYTGYVNDEKLVSLYQGAKAFVMPSFEEGFGIPILEAMACGTAVVTSNVGSLPEVGGNAAIYFDPNVPEDMASKISVVLNDEKLRKQLIEKGKKRAKLFSWKKMAEQTLEVYNKCV